MPRQDTGKAPKGRKFTLGLHRLPAAQLLLVPEEFEAHVGALRQCVNGVEFTQQQWRDFCFAGGAAGKAIRAADSGNGTPADLTKVQQFFNMMAEIQSHIQSAGHRYDRTLTELTAAQMLENAMAQMQHNYQPRKNFDGDPARGDRGMLLPSADNNESGAGFNLFGAIRRRVGFTGALTTTLAVASPLIAIADDVSGKSAEELMNNLKRLEKQIKKEYGKVADNALKAIKKYRTLYPKDKARLAAVEMFAKRIIAMDMTVLPDEAGKTKAAGEVGQEAEAILRENAKTILKTPKNEVDDKLVEAGARIAGRLLGGLGSAKEKEGYRAAYYKNEIYQRALDYLNAEIERINAGETSLRQATDQAATEVKLQCIEDFKATKYWNLPADSVQALYDKLGDACKGPVRDLLEASNIHVR